MTEYKEHNGGPAYRSLYIGLLYTVLRGILFAVTIWLVIMMVSYYVIGVYYTTPDMKRERRARYFDDLQRFVTENEISVETASEISEWVRDNPYVYLLVYYETNPTDENNRMGELVGAQIDDTLSREELVAEANEGGHRRIRFSSRGGITVAIAEYTENLYYSSFNYISLAMAGLIFVLSLVRYIGVIIERIKRFESDVTIVSEIDMNYEIISEGTDEIATLSGKVEQMRQSMLQHIRNEQEARETNAELIASISHDIRTPLTVLMGYIEMMKERGGQDETMDGYVAATESTALRLKQLSDDMFKYSLAFGDAEKSVKLEEYDARTLIDQLFSEHFFLMREMGYDLRVDNINESVAVGSVIRSDAPILMRIIDNVFSNLRKYADPSEPIIFTVGVDGGILQLECRNKIRTNTEGAESNGIGLKTCVRLASLVAKKFEYFREDDSFICRLTIAIRNGDAGASND